MANKYIPTKKMIKSKSIWAVYKGEECLAIGTFDEIEEKLNLSRNTMFYYVSNAYKKRLSKMKQKETNIHIVLVEKVKGVARNYKEEYKKRKCKDEYNNSK